MYDITSELNKSDTISQPDKNEDLLRKLISKYEDIAVENVFLKARLDAIEKKLKEPKLNE